jgi:hypothetical protein
MDSWRPTLGAALGWVRSVVDVERGHDTLGEHPGAKAPRRASADAALEDQGDLIGTSEIEVVTDHLLEEDPPRN